MTYRPIGSTNFTHSLVSARRKTFQRKMITSVFVNRIPCSHFAGWGASSRSYGRTNVATIGALWFASPENVAPHLSRRTIGQNNPIRQMCLNSWCGSSTCTRNNLRIATQSKLPQCKTKLKMSLTLRIASTAEPDSVVIKTTDDKTLDRSGDPARSSGQR